MVNKKHASPLFNLLIIISLFLINSTTYAAVIAKIDRNQIALNESFTLTYDSDSSADNPDFSLLEIYFDILNTSRSSNTSIINGQIKQSYTWTLVLFPKQAGTLTIPSISFGNDKSQPITITVTQPNQTSSNTAEPVFMEVEATPKNPYVQSQVLYTVRIYHSVDISNASLSEPDIKQSDAVVKKLGEDSRFEKWIDNQRYIVYERTYIIYPQKSGNFTINPLRFEARILQSSRSFFDPFRSSGRLIRLVSDKIELNVQAIPQSYTGSSWLPSQQIRLSENWATNPSEFKVGEPITRTITVSAVGLTSAQIPEINIPNSNDFKQYPDQPYLEDKEDKNGITGIRQEKIAMIPTKDGRVILPAIEIDWWNTVTNKLETARIPEKTLLIKATQINKPVQAIQQQTLANENTDIDTSNNTIIQQVTNPYWMWASAFFASAWFLTILLWWKSNHKNLNTRQLKNKNKEKLTIIKNQLKKACNNGDVGNAKTLLLNWAKLKLPENTPTSLGELSSYMDDALKEEISKLNNALYSQNHSNWDGNALWYAFQQCSDITTSSNKLNTALEPLNKI